MKRIINIGNIFCRSVQSHDVILIWVNDRGISNKRFSYSRANENPFERNARLSCVLNELCIQIFFPTKLADVTTENSRKTSHTVEIVNT